MQTIIYYYWRRYRQLYDERNHATAYLKQNSIVKLDYNAVDCLVRLGRFKDIYNFVIEQDYWETKGKRIDLTINKQLLDVLKVCNWQFNYIKAGTFKSNLNFNADYATDKLNQELLLLTESWEKQYCSLVALDLVIDSFTN